MKAIKYEKTWDVACVEMDKPVRKKGEALIKIMTAGICGSDIGAFRGTNGLVSILELSDMNWLVSSKRSMRTIQRDLK